MSYTLMKDSVVDIGSDTLPAFLVEQTTDLAAHDPAAVGEPFLPICL
jgi:hypothetical protein